MMLGARTAAWSGGKILPYKRRLAWIGSNGGVYFDLGLKADFRSFRCKHQHSEKAECLFGAKYGAAWNAPVYRLVTSKYSEYIPGVTIDIKGLIEDCVVTSDKVTMTNNYIVDYRTWTKTIPATYAVDENVKTLNMYLFASNRENDSVEYISAIGKFYELEFFADGIDTKSLLHIYPVIDNNDVVCMFDEVSGKCLYNLGTGEPTYGELEGITT